MTQKVYKFATYFQTVLSVEPFVADVTDVNSISLAPCSVVHQMLRPVESPIAGVTSERLVLQMGNQVSLEMLKPRERFVTDLAHVQFPPASEKNANQTNRTWCNLVLTHEWVRAVANGSASCTASHIPYTWKALRCVSACGTWVHLTSWSTLHTNGMWAGVDCCLQTEWSRSRFLRLLWFRLVPVLHYPVLAPPWINRTTHK